MELKPGVIIEHEEFPGDYFIIVQRDTLINHQNPVSKSYSYHYSPVDQPWYFLAPMPFYGFVRSPSGVYFDKELYPSWPPTKENSIVRKDSNIFHYRTKKYKGANKKLAFEFSVIPFREFNKRGFRIAPKAAQMLYGKKNFDYMRDLPISPYWLIEDPF